MIAGYQFLLGGTSEQRHKGQRLFVLTTGTIIGGLLQYVTNMQWTIACSAVCIVIYIVTVHEDMNFRDQLSGLNTRSRFEIYLSERFGHLRKNPRSYLLLSISTVLRTSMTTMVIYGVDEFVIFYSVRSEKMVKDLIEKFTAIFDILPRINSWDSGVTEECLSDLNQKRSSVFSPDGQCPARFIVGFYHIRRPLNIFCLQTGIHPTVKTVG